MSVPPDCFKKDADVNSASDLEHLLRTMRFWSLKQFPGELVLLVMHEWHSGVGLIIEKYISSADFQALSEMMFDDRMANYPTRLHTIVKHGRLDFLIYYVEQRGSPMFSDMTELAAVNGHLSCLEFLSTHMDNAFETFQVAKSSTQTTLSVSHLLWRKALW